MPRVIAVAKHRLRHPGDVMGAARRAHGVAVVALLVSSSSGFARRQVPAFGRILPGSAQARPVSPDTTPARPAAPSGDWPAYAGDPGNAWYSPLADIDRSNVTRLRLVWTWSTGERQARDGSGPALIGAGKFEATPLAIRDTLFLTTPAHRVVALDGATGTQLWAFDPARYLRGQPRAGHRFVHRGLALWVHGRARRLFHLSRGRLIALDPATGAPVLSFGDSGVVDVLSAMRWSGDPDHVDNTAPPAVFDDLVIVGTSVSDDVTYSGDPPGAVMAFDARTGRIRWVFHTIPRRAEPGSETWGESPVVPGHANVWSAMAVDTARGLVYLPVSAASNDYYGGDRPGAGLFSEALVCLDARTGKRKWHFQTVHHGLWDYDLPGPPVLATVRRGDRVQAVVAVAGKTGFVYVFDRVTGTPVWPIEERAVPASDVPGESAAPAQPFPTRPAPFVRQGFSENDLIDFTPALRDSARARLRGVRFGPLFTPPSLGGTVVSPGRIGGAAWGGAAYDPERQLLIVKGNNYPTIATLIAPPPGDLAVAARYFGVVRQGWKWPVPPATRWARLTRTAPPRPEAELPISKPPYGTVTAIDMATGEQRWQVTVGHWPELETHPALRGLRLPLVGSVGTSGAIVTAGGLVFISGGSTSLHALDADTGRQLWEARLRGKGQANPMTYGTRGGRQFVVIASTSSQGGELQAFALP